MSLLHSFVDLFVHLDVHLADVIAQYGVVTYAILFVIIFCETGLVVTPFLPGDSLLFAAGAFAALGSLNMVVLVVLLWLAAVLGDTVNYHLGKMIGPRVFKENRWFLNHEKLMAAERFYEVHGNKAILFARFVPIIRTLAPFVAGVGRMDYSKFIFWNIFGGTLWVLLCLFAGFFFGNIPFVKEHFTVVILGIIAVSLLPPVYHAIREKLRPKDTPGVIR
jgi:membrane-associated protein